jgi:hypothetical protein
MLAEDLIISGLLPVAMFVLDPALDSASSLAIRGERRSGLDSSSSRESLAFSNDSVAVF